MYMDDGGVCGGSTFTGVNIGHLSSLQYSKMFMIQTDTCHNIKGDVTRDQGDDCEWHIFSFMTISPSL